VDEIRDSVSGQAGLLVELLTASMAPELKRVGLSLATFELLSAVQAGGGRAAQADIAKRLGISAPSLSESVGNAVRKGFLIQIANGADARVKQLKLTPEGRTAVRTILKAIAEAETSMLAGLTEEQVGDTIDVLTVMTRNLARRLERARTSVAS